MKRIQCPKTKTGIEADCESETETQLGLNDPRREFRRSRKINNRRKRQQGRRIKSFGHEEESANNVSSWPSCDGGCSSISTTIKRGSQIQIQIHTWLPGNTYPPLPLFGKPTVVACQAQNKPSDIQIFCKNFTKRIRQQQDCGWGWISTRRGVSSGRSKVVGGGDEGAARHELRLRH